MPANLSTLTALAQAATPGPWIAKPGDTLKSCNGIARPCNHPSEESCYDERVEECPGKDEIVTTDGGYYGPDWATAQFIAACDPQTILGLVARVNELEAALKTYGQHQENCHLRVRHDSSSFCLSAGEHGCTCGFTTAIRGTPDG